MISPQAAACVLTALAVFASGAAASQQCRVTFRADGTELLGGLELRVDYSGAPGTFGGTGEGVKCTGLAPASWQSARDDDAGAELDLGLISGAGVPLPQDLWRCDFTASNVAPAVDDFLFTIDDALTPLSEPMSLEVSVNEISCDSSAICGDGIIESAEECDDGFATAACDDNCQLTRDSQRCAVTFVASGTGTLGGVQFGVDYSDASGAFQGEGIDVDCSRALVSSFTAMEDVDSSQILNLALMSPGGLALPADLWTCTFVSSGAVLATSNFHYLDLSATDVDAKSKTVNLSARIAACVYGPYCGDGAVDPEETCDDGNRVNTDSCSNTCTAQNPLCGNGVTNAGEQCDDGNNTAGDCCSPACTYESSATVCRAVAGVCDVAENCTGTSGSCPGNAKRTSVCRAASGVCDLAESCNGSSITCPADGLSNSVCRPAAGTCDVAESCTGSSPACPTDTKSTSGCRLAVGACDVTESCSGLSNTCPADSFQPPGTACTNGLFCDGADTCSGGACSLHAGNPCSGADGDGDCSETCSESSDNCSANDPDGSTCNDGNSSTTGDQCLTGACVGGTASVICGDADGNGSVSATDALRILRAAVGLPTSCPLPRCDIDNNGKLAASDALKVLKKAVGQTITMACPAA